MDELKNNMLVWILAAVTLFNVGAFLVGKVLIDKTADRVIKKLQKEYSPSPYGPGVDPDKVGPEALKSQKHHMQVMDRAVKAAADADEKRRDDWERERFSR